MISLSPLSRAGLAWAQSLVTSFHYLHRPVDSRCSVEGYQANLDLGAAGVLLFGRPEATRCRDWYGSVEDARSGRCEVTRWQVLNLARAWIWPEFQAGGGYYSPEYLPGYTDRRGVWRSTLASEIIRAACERVGFDYLVRRPPVWVNEPYQIEYLLSYCDTRIHRGTIYAAAGFELYATNDRGIQTWRRRLPVLTCEQDAQVRESARVSPRSNQYRAKRAQMAFEL